MSSCLTAFKSLFGIGCRLLRQSATKFLMDDIYRNPGPLQFDGPGSDAKAVILYIIILQSHALTSMFSFSY